MKFVRVVFVNLSVLFVLLILLDGFLWIFFPIEAERTAIEKTYKQNIPGVKTVVSYKRNEFGLRSLSMTKYEKPQDVIRIFCTGASTTQQITQQTEDTWCGLLEIKLNEKYNDSGFRIETASYGGGGLRALDNAKYIQEYIDRIDPDIVVTLLGINDLALNGGPDYVYRSPAEELGKTTWNIKDNLRKYSQLRRRWKMLKLYYAIKTGKTIVKFNDKLPSVTKNYRSLKYQENINRNPDPLHEFSDVVSWMAEYLTEKGVTLILLGQPVLWDKEMVQENRDALWFPIATPKGSVRTSGAWLVTEMGKYNNMQKQVAFKQNNVYYVDLDSVIPKDLKYFFDDCHFTDLGSLAVLKNTLPTITEAVDAVLAKRERN